ncbi:putative B3 domain-containing protein [Sesamum angolense]|uniref:B3 domain-containing protein n=1 Tax=Sesamum angolense TaxID=2727404 RepID=A0AAE2C473_9LAMI|nr:putative B3 domain-containing protein [Sesamum angolense]
MAASSLSFFFFHSSSDAAPHTEAHCYSSIVPTHEDAITSLPQYDYKGKRKMSEFSASQVNPPHKTAPTQPPALLMHLTLHSAGPPTFKQTENTFGRSPSPNMARSSFPPPSTHLSGAQYDKGKGKIPQFFDVFSSEGKPADEITPTKAAVSTHLSLHFDGTQTFKRTKIAIGPSPSPNMARSSFPSTHLSDVQYDKGKGKMPQFFDVFNSEGKPADEIAPAEAGVSTHLSLHFAGPPTSKQTKNALGPIPNPNMAWSSFPSSSTLSNAQFGKGKGKMPQFFDVFTSEGKPADEIAQTEAGVSTHLSLHFAGPPTFKQTKSAIGPSQSPNMARSSFPSSSRLSDAQYDKGKAKMPQFFDFFASEGKLAVDTTTFPTAETGFSPHLISLLHFAGPPKKTAVVSPRYSPPAPRGVAVVPGNMPALTGDRWDIKKVLKQSDVDVSSRLLLAKVDVHEHILPHVMGNGPGLDEGQGVEVAVWDLDTGSEHVLVLKKWKSTGSFVLKKNWMSEFVRRRGLEKNDEIGLRWDGGNSRLEFTVLKKN